nr:hypothetical protein [Tanacetum cinerariifolium]
MALPPRDRDTHFLDSRGWSTLMQILQILRGGWGRFLIKGYTGCTSATPAAALVVRTMPQRMARLEEEVHGIRESLDEQHEVTDTLASNFSKFTVWTARGIPQLLDATGATYTRYSETHVPY